MEVVIENLVKIYGAQNAVDHISFSVKKGEVVGFLGPNGAGKTTTMKILTNYLAPTSGQVTIGGHSVMDDPEETKQLIGYLPENNPLYLDMAIFDYLEFSARLQGVAKKDVQARIKKMIEVCGLGVEQHKKIGEISKGFRQRVGLAQAMIHDPEVLILDEPTTGLDPNQIVEIRKLIKELGKEKTVILSTHILPEVESTCDRILIINKGKIVADGTPATLREQASGSEVVKITVEGSTSDAIIKQLMALESVAKVEQVKDKPNEFMISSNSGSTSRKDIFQCAVQNKWILTELYPFETRLEDIFRNLTMN